MAEESGGVGIFLSHQMLQPPIAASSMEFGVPFLTILEAIKDGRRIWRSGGFPASLVIGSIMVL